MGCNVAARRRRTLARATVLLDVQTAQCRIVSTCTRAFVRQEDTDCAAGDAGRTAPRHLYRPNPKQRSVSPCLRACAHVRATWCACRANRMYTRVRHVATCTCVCACRPACVRVHPVAHQVCTDCADCKESSALSLFNLGDHNCARREKLRSKPPVEKNKSTNSGP